MGGYTPGQSMMRKCARFIADRTGTPCYTRVPETHPEEFYHVALGNEVGEVWQLHVSFDVAAWAPTALRAEELARSCVSALRDATELEQVFLVQELSLYEDPDEQTDTPRFYTHCEIVIHGLEAE